MKTEYLIDYRPGAGGEFLSTCILLLTNSINYNEILQISSEGKVHKSNNGMIIFEWPLTADNVKRYILDRKNIIDDKNSPDILITSSHHGFSDSVPDEPKSYFNFLKEFHFKNKFYIRCENSDEYLRCYFNWLIKDNKSEKSDLYSNLQRVYNLDTKITGKHEYLDSIGYTKINYSDLHNKNPEVLANILGKYMDVTITDEYINFVAEYHRLNKKTNTESDLRISKLKNSTPRIRELIEEFDNGNSKRKSTWSRTLHR